jgi:nucleoside-triphosphatase THEP1
LPQHKQIKELEVKVSGTMGAGKTVLLDFIEQKLKEAGCKTIEYYRMFDSDILETVSWKGWKIHLIEDGQQSELIDSLREHEGHLQETIKKQRRRIEELEKVNKTLNDAILY